MSGPELIGGRAVQDEVAGAQQEALLDYVEIPLSVNGSQ
jgi:hypothetical protein